MSIQDWSMFTEFLSTESSLGTVVEYQACKFFLTILDTPGGTVIDGLQKPVSLKEAKTLILLLSTVAKITQRNRREWALNFSDVCDQMYMWVLVLATLTFPPNLVQGLLLDTGMSPVVQKTAYVLPSPPLQGIRVFLWGAYYGCDEQLLPSPVPWQFESGH